MKLWMLFVVGAILSWGSYVPMIHQGQAYLQKGALRAFLCVGGAYFLTAVVVPLVLLANGAEPFEFTRAGIGFSTLAGILGAIGALCVILALKSGGMPIYVAPLVFAGAPIVAAFVDMIWHRPSEAPPIWFWLGLVLAATGASLVLRFKPH